MHFKWQSEVGWRCEHNREKTAVIIFLVVRHIKGKNTGHIDLKDIDYELHILVFVCAFSCLYKLYLVKGGFIAYNVIIRAIKSS